MSDYVPMKGPLPGRQYEPSNGTEGGCFLDAWCSNCARDKAMREGVDLDECDDDEKCEIIAASFRGEAVEWRELDNGDTVCLAFIEAGTEPPAPRCEHTADMFWRRQAFPATGANVSAECAGSARQRRSTT